MTPLEHNGILILRYSLGQNEALFEVPAISGEFDTFEEAVAAIDGMATNDPVGVSDDSCQD
jgi:hypothetical protein